MPHMMPEITNCQKWIVVVGPMGNEFIPLDVWAKQEVQKVLNSLAVEETQSTFSKWLCAYTENSEAWHLRLIEGYGARLSAPGYIDCTEWCVLENENEAREYLEEMYDICSYCGEEFSEENDTNTCHKCGRDYIVKY